MMRITVDQYYFLIYFWIASGNPHLSESLQNPEPFKPFACRLSLCMACTFKSYIVLAHCIGKLLFCRCCIACMKLLWVPNWKEQWGDEVPVCRIRQRKVSAPRTNTSNLHSHLHDCRPVFDCFSLKRMLSCSFICDGKEKFLDKM